MRNADESDVQREERLAAAFDEIARDGSVDWDQIGRQHPDLVDELKQLRAVGEVVDIFIRSGQSTVAHHDARPVAMLLPERVDRYRIEAELGRGGMGVVYKAFDSELQRHVAIKMILRGGHASAEDVARFRTEAKSAGTLEHPHIVPVFHVGESDGQAYFVMKYIPGPTLAQLVSGKPMTPRRAAEIVRDVALGIAHAHQRGVLHRDLKPSNILMDDNQRPLVTDFGLARSVEGGSSLTGTGAILGTPSYMAPEQAEARSDPSPASDVYSLGAILYELLTGRPPFLAATPVDTLLLVRTEEPAPPRLLSPNLDLDLELICLKCLEKNPRHRYPSAESLARDLEAFLAGEPVSARTNSLIYFVSRFFRDTHYAPVLENWGVLWMWHSLKLFLLCGVTGLMYAWGVRRHAPYLVLWSVGLIVWGIFFWNLRRRGGPVQFVERQIAHAWAGGIVGSIVTFLIEVIMGLEVLALTPLIAVNTGIIFLVKAGTLTGGFYWASAAYFASSLLMAWIGAPWSPVIFGLVSALSFFLPGLKYYLQVRRNAKRT